MEAFWEKNAGTWTQCIQDSLIESRKTTNPAIISEILKGKPQSVIDLGCGEGWIGAELAPRRIEYLGLDGSKALIQLARQTHPRNRFELASYQDLISGRWKSPSHFDVAVFNFALMDEEVAPILVAAKELIGEQGSIIIQTLHPCFSLEPYEDGWRNETFSAFPVAFNGEMAWYGRTLSSWTQLISRAGLKVFGITEPAHPVTGEPLSLILTLIPW